MKLKRTETKKNLFKNISAVVDRNTLLDYSNR